MARIDYDQASATYDQGREHPLADLKGWRDAFSHYLPPAEERPVLDAGCGTGLYSHALATWFDVSVIGLEQSAGMRRQAVSKRRHGNVRYIGGDAQRIPLADGTCGAALLSNVIHHIADLPACARELRRVLVHGAPVFIRGAFPGHVQDITLFRYFPEAIEAVDTFPSVEFTTELFTAVGFAFDSFVAVRQITAPSLRVYCDRVAIRADTTLLHMTDDEFAARLAELKAAADLEANPTPVVDEINLLVFI